MPTDHRAVLASIRRFDQLIAYLRDEMGWPIARDSFDDVDDLFFDFTAEELGIDAKNAAKIQEIKRLRPLSVHQPWGIFFVKFEAKRLSVVALRRILSQVSLKKRASANKTERAAWSVDDLLFISNYGEGEARQISFAHFSQSEAKKDLPTLRVLGWDNLDTRLHLDDAAEKLTNDLAWPVDELDVDGWRERWRGAFSLRHGEVITTSKELSLRLAELARAIRDRIQTALDIETESGPLTSLMKAFRDALIHDLDRAGFADMYAQTIAYGLLSARIADPERKTADDFAAQMRTNPFLKELMETFLDAGGRRGQAGGPAIDFDELGVSEVVALLDEANMEAVVTDFGDRNPQEDPVIHFYEHFLEAYDKEQKVGRGVFYTPRPVVSYIVRSVDRLLLEEYGLSEGLADTSTWGEVCDRLPGLEIPDGVAETTPFVQILDPATGTGTFLVEVIDLIHDRMISRWTAEGHGGSKVVELWNEYVPRSLLNRIHGYELLMAPYAVAHLKISLKLHETGYRFDDDARLRVYLTNALEPAPEDQIALDLLPALAHEAEAVGKVKRDHRFTVILGNPPYSNFGQLNRVPFILELLDDYKRGLSERKLNLDDDFIKFLRLFQYEIDRSGTGVLGCITSHTYISGLTHRQMRASLLDSFNQLRIVDLHGNKVVDEVAPGGITDQNVFDIKQGVSITLGARSLTPACIRYAELWGDRASKYERLSAPSDFEWETLEPSPPHYYFYPYFSANETEFLEFTSLDDVFQVNSSGIQTKRDALFVAFDRDELSDRWQELLRVGPDDERMAKKYPLHSTGGWSPEVLVGARFDERNIRRYTHRPFDDRFIYYDPELLGRPRWEVFKHFLYPNTGISTLRQTVDTGFRHVYCVTGLCDLNLTINHHVSDRVFPLYLYERDDLFDGLNTARSPNLRPTAIDSLAASTDLRWTPDVSGISDDAFGPEAVLAYVVAVMHSSVYRERYWDSIRVRLPRIPLAPTTQLFRALVIPGASIVEAEGGGNEIDSESIEWIGDIPSAIVHQPDLKDSTLWIDAAQTCGVRPVRSDIWGFRIGAYQVCRKWLKDRSGRSLSSRDIDTLRRVVLSIDTVLKATSDIDAIVEEHGGWPGAFLGGR